MHFNSTLSNLIQINLITQSILNKATLLISYQFKYLIFRVNDCFLN